MQFKPVTLIILDGFGLSDDDYFNAVNNAHKPNIERFFAEYPNSRLDTSGENVGLPDGQMGNSEVGHLNIGAGRIVYQDLTRISKSIKDGSFFQNIPLNNAFKIASEQNSSVHIMGLLSDGGVHSHIEHLFALLKLAQLKSFSKVYIHCFMDGRDTSPTSGKFYLKQLKDFIAEIKVGKIASVMGRFYAMDRDNRWERVKEAAEILINGSSTIFNDPIAEVESRYSLGETDEFLVPFMVEKGATIKDNDVVIFFNFRADRAREMTTFLTQPNFDRFDIRPPKLAYYVSMNVYDEKFNLAAAFPPERPKNILGEVLSNYGLTQLRIAETEKYAHVTYFFNGGEETPFKNEERVLIQSPKDVKTYDQKPEMSAYIVTEELLSRIDSDKYDFIVVNYANCDMVGHTGVYEAAVKAVEVVDLCVGRVVDKVIAKGGAALIISDHGNSEQMLDKYGKPHTAHTTNSVPCILVTPLKDKFILKNGKLADVAPSILKIMGIPKPNEMSGEEIIF